MARGAKLPEYSYRLTGLLCTPVRIWNPDRVGRNKKTIELGLLSIFPKL
jgi:hypothetical protein